MTALSNSTDVFIAGGGPAGLAAAIAARLQGFEVTVADAARPPIDKACGEGLMPDSAEPLRELGVALPMAGACGFRGIRFLSDEAEVASDFPDARGIGVRRTVLHQLLIDRAEALGVSLEWGTRVTGFTGDVVELDGREVRCRWLIGADGQNSRVRRWTGLDATRYESRRFGFRRHYRVAPWSDHVEVHWGPGCQMYVTPVGDCDVCLVLVSRDAHLRFDQALGHFPEVASRVAGAESCGAERGGITVSRGLQRVYRGNTILVGDASGSVDAITGEGLSLAFRQALLLARAMRSGDAAGYQVEHRRLMKRPATMGDLMLLLDRSPVLRRRVIRAFAAEPWIFANLLAMHTGGLSTADLLFRGILPLGWQMMLA